MKRSGISLLTAVFFTATGFSQEIKNIEVIMNPKLLGKNELPYSEKALSWEAFRGIPDNNSQFIAMTYSGFRISHSYSVRNGEATARVELFPYMDVTRSWYKKNHCNELTLAHEQRHFDITALITRMFAEEIKRTRYTVSGFSQSINALYSTYMNQIADMQKEYDGETMHGTISEKQVFWDEKITGELKKIMADR